MGNLNVRIDDDLKARSFAALEKLGVTPSELLRQTLEYVAENGKLPFYRTLLNDEDRQLIEIVRERLRDPKPVRVTLDDL
ncbi:type II toxin-antitoxin system RelB/DinJ family antitoxin [Kosakonia sacchari]|uniref:type II toxin-antitoxin system RelB/DinJ family antitoxin n=1 Tax=Kosakonia sacchari TaxID=1158459 RepID=UPI002ACE4F02|nr:type II toxin-antitoxin system RelB/DinJ family antitoxin [Kosakonia sacchari]MDZ7324582.1 type II toxin-antitoxin system RelB/DinJ family antitoxin [Kosakonia sacchari]